MHAQEIFVYTTNPLIQASHATRALLELSKQESRNQSSRGSKSHPTRFKLSTAGVTDAQDHFHTHTARYVTLHKKNENIHPFEDPASLEFLALKNDCGVVVFGTHSKKRPNNITVLRTFDSKTLDIVELLLITPEHDLEQARTLRIAVGMKPMILFAGSQWKIHPRQNKPPSTKP